MRITKLTIGIVLGLAVFLLLLTSALHWVTFDLELYEKNFVANNIAAELQVDTPTLSVYARALTEYLQGGRSTPNVTTVIRGQASNLFNERELLHLEDVRKLFALSYLIRNVALAAIIATAVIAYRFGITPVATAYTYTASYVLTSIAILSGLAVIDFNKYFTLFHLLSFSNDLWLLDPATDNLIVMFPESFFAGAALRIALATVSVYALTLAVAIYIKIKLRGDSNVPKTTR